MKITIITTLLLSLSLTLLSQGTTCDDAVEITINNTYASNGPSDGEGCFTCPGATVNADWFKFTPTTNTNVSISSCIDGLDTHFFVYIGGCGSLIEIASNDDAGCGVGTNFASYTEFAVAAGTEYFIEWVDHWSTSGFDFAIEEIVCPIPTNLSFNTLTNQSVIIDWDSSNNGVTYVLEYGEFGFTLGEGTQSTGVVGTDGPTVLIDGLIANTAYELYLIENCDGGDVVTAPINFVTFTSLADNDVCANSTEIGCGDALSGSTSEATVDLDAIDCGPVEVDANGVWYHFIGVEGLITLSTCGSNDFDTRISVYSGDCDNLTCESANDDDITCVNFASTTHFPATTGVDYYILVHGFEGASGDFTLSLNCGELCAPVPANGDCNTAINVDPTVGCTMTAATNQCASINLSNPECSPFEETQDIWYSFNSGAFNAMGIDINLIDAEEIGMSIYPSCGGEELFCFESFNNDLQVISVAPNTDYLIQFWSEYDDAGAFEFCLRSDVCSGSTNIVVNPISDNSVEIVWETPNAGEGFGLEYGNAGFIPGSGNSISGELGVDGPPVVIIGLGAGTVYEFYITETCEFGSIVSGPFTFTTSGSVPTNNTCANATSVELCSEIINGTTVNASVSTVPECNSVASTSPGVWYSGTAPMENLYFAQTCNDANFDTKISVFTGTCDNLECVNANDDSGSCNDGTSSVEYSANEGQQIYILVHGFASESGTFGLTVACAEGVAENRINNNFNIYPNPSDGNITIDYSNTNLKSNVTITIYNALGKMAYQSSMLRSNNAILQNISLGDLSTGLYTLTLSDGETQISDRLIIE